MVDTVLCQKLGLASVLQTQHGRTLGVSHVSNESPWVAVQAPAHAGDELERHAFRIPTTARNASKSPLTPQEIPNFLENRRGNPSSGVFRGHEPILAHWAGSSDTIYSYPRSSGVMYGVPRTNRWFGQGCRGAGNTTSTRIELRKRANPLQWCYATDLEFVA